MEEEYELYARELDKFLSTFSESEVIGILARCIHIGASVLKRLGTSVDGNQSYYNRFLGDVVRSNKVVLERSPTTIAAQGIQSS